MTFTQLEIFAKVAELGGFTAAAEQLGISATPVREALLRLVSEQALQLDERGTVFVPVIDRARFLEIRSLRCNLEGQAAAAAASRAGAEQIIPLKSKWRARQWQTLQKASVLS